MGQLYSRDVFVGNARRQRRCHAADNPLEDSAK
ncbi:hypothetical protein QE396_000774 [Enterobacter sp. SORGH_AS 287]|nr:hypothetical protein [Enterobacter ludwigii]MDR6364846.1 hypothetical protein [Enterobacter sp. SORGH_AS_0287]